MEAQLSALLDHTIDQLISWTPRVVVAAVVLLIGTATAWLIERILVVILKRLRLSEAMTQLGGGATLERLGFSRPAHRLIPRVVFYLVLILALRTASDALALAAVSNAIGTVLAYVPNVIAALVVLLVGGAVAQFAGKAVRSGAETAGLQFADTLGSAVSGLIIFVLAIMAMAELRIDTEMIRVVATAALGALALAFGLSFGLGSKDVTRGVLAGFYARQLLHVGQHIEVGGRAGRLVAITSTQLVLETEDGRTTVPNTVLLDSSMTEVG